MLFASYLSYIIRQVTPAAFLFTVAVGSPSSAEIKRIAIIEGDRGYKNPASAENPKPNWQVLKNDTLPKIFEHAQIKYFPVSQPNVNGDWKIGQNIGEFKPDLILAHWSAFSTRRERDVQRDCTLLETTYKSNCAKYCDLSSNQAGRECARKLFNLLSEIRESSNVDTKIVIYTKKSNFCAGPIQKKMLEFAREEGEGSVASRMIGSTGFMIMTSSPNRAWFGDNKVEDDLRDLVKYLQCPSTVSWNQRIRVNSGLCTLGQPYDNQC